MATKAHQANGRLPEVKRVLIAHSVITSREQQTLMEWTAERLVTGALRENGASPGDYLTPFFLADRTSTNRSKEIAESRRRRKALSGLLPVDDLANYRLPDEFWHVRERVVESLELSHLIEDTVKGSFLNYITPGGGIHSHRDSRISVDGRTYMLLRCNVLFAKPEAGGAPVIAGRELDIPDRGMWAFYASEYIHSATTVSGPTGRGTLSYGFMTEAA